MISIERILQVTGALVVLLGVLAPLHRRLMDFGAPKPEAAHRPAPNAPPVGT